MDPSSLDPHRLLILVGLYSGRDIDKMLHLYDIPVEDLPRLRELARELTDEALLTIIHRLAGYGYLYELSEMLTWRDFERLVAIIFEENSYRVHRNLRIRRFEYDVVAIGRGRIFCIDCKQWNRRLTPSKAREVLKGLYRRCPLLTTRFNGRIYPLITTLVSDRILYIDGSAAVPITYLNSFLQSIDTLIYEEILKPLPSE